MDDAGRVVVWALETDEVGIDGIEDVDWAAAANVANVEASSTAAAADTEWSTIADGSSWNSSIIGLN